ncbi:MAG: CHAT domain-containing protein [Candidatus Bathyarchaeia archaeon]
MVQSYPILRLRRVGKKLECELTNPTSMQMIGIDVKMPQGSEEVIYQQYAKILRITSNDEASNPKIFERQLKKLGSEIGKVLGQVLRRLAFEIKKECNLGLALDDETVKIPWELGLLHKSLVGGKRAKFFCDVACIGRLRVVKNDFWKPSPKKEGPIRALVVGIDYKDYRRKGGRKLDPLECAEEEAERVKTILENNDIHVKLLTGKNATFNSIIEELKRGVDIFHFTGHGGTSWNKSRICLYDKDLWAEDLEKLLANSPAPSLSFFNACETSVDTHKIGKVKWAPYSFAFSLANQDGSVFIGTLWSVFEREATRFAGVFYQKFLGIRNNVLAEAMRLARNEVKKGKYAILTWPAYILYGPPTLRRDDLFAKKGY